MRLTLLLPTLNEAEGLPRTLARFPVDALRGRGYQTQVVVVDGHSTDGTPERARELGASVIAEPRPGYGRAYKTALPQLNADLVATADADDTYPVDALPELLERFKAEGLDFATVDRLAGMQRGAMSGTHRFGNWVLTTATRVLYGVRVRDSQSGMWILSRRALERIPLDRLSDGMAFSQELKLTAYRHPELKAAELPGRYYARVGDAKLSRWRDGLGNLWRLLRLRFRRDAPWKARR